MADQESYAVGQAPWEQGDAAEHPDSFPVGKAPWETGEGQKPDVDTMVKQNISDMRGAAKTSNNALFDTLTLGHLPQIEAKAAQVWNGEGWANDANYVRRRDQNIADMKGLADQYPMANAQGKVAGFALPMIATMGASAPEQAAIEAPELAGEVADSGSKLIKAATTIGKGAATGAVMGGAQNPGDTAGVVDPLQLQQRAKNAKTGAEVGGTLSAAAGALPLAADKIQEFANTKAMKAAGAMLKDFRKAYSNDAVQDTGKFILDNKLVQAGDTFADVADKADAMRQDVGKKLGDGYDAAAQIIPTLEPEAQAKVAQAGFNPVRDKDAILSQVKNDLGYAYKGKSALQGVSDYLDQLAEQHGDSVLNPRTTNDIKSALDKTAINWERNPLAREPDAEAALKSLRSALNNKVKGQIQAVGEAIGNDDAAKGLSDLNHQYGMANNVSTMAADKANREMANAAVGLGDSAAGTGGAVIGGALAGGPGAAVGEVAGIAASKAGRRYGASTAADVANRAAQTLKQIPQPSIAQQANPAIYGATANGVEDTTRNAPVYYTPPGAQNARPNAPATAPTPAASPNPPTRIPADTPDKAPTKGPEKWARDGFQNLMDHAEDPGELERLVNTKMDLLKDPKAKDLLVKASDLKPGTAAMDKIAAKLKNHMDGG